MRHAPTSLDDGSRPYVVGYVLTYNCDGLVQRAVGSLLGVMDQVVVVDSGSTDRTREVAERCGATVLTRPFDSFSAQRNWAIEEVIRRFQPSFIFSLDSDEWLDQELAHDLDRRIRSRGLAADVYLIRRRVHFDGRLLKWGGFGETRLVRLFRAGRCYYEDRLVNEHLHIPEAASRATLAGAIEHADVDSWTRHIEKHNRYSSLEAFERCALAQHPGERLTLRAALRRPDLRKRWLREHIWARVPNRPVVRFLQVLVFKAGCLDGRAGLRRAIFEAWQEMCIDLKAEAISAGREP